MMTARMSLTEIKAALDDTIARQAYLMVERRLPGEPRLHGYVLARSDRLLLLHRFHDFHHDGWIIVRIEDVTEVESENDTRRFFADIHHAEGLLPAMPPFPINLWTMQTVAKALQAQTRLVIIESETMDAEEDDFILGHILGVDDEAVTVRPMDARGHWMEVEQVELGAITQIGIETPYLLMFAKHGDPPPPPAATD
jgi:hypothetical protein